MEPARIFCSHFRRKKHPKSTHTHTGERDHKPVTIVKESLVLLFVFCFVFIFLDATPFVSFDMSMERLFGQICFDGRSLLEAFWLSCNLRRFFWVNNNKKKTRNRQKKKKNGAGGSSSPILADVFPRRKRKKKQETSVSVRAPQSLIGCLI